MSINTENNKTWGMMRCIRLFRFPVPKARGKCENGSLLTLVEGESYSSLAYHIVYDQMDLSFLISGLF